MVGLEKEEEETQEMEAMAVLLHISLHPFMYEVVHLEVMQQVEAVVVPAVEKVEKVAAVVIEE